MEIRSDMEPKELRNYYTKLTGNQLDKATDDLAQLFHLAIQIVSNVHPDDCCDNGAYYPFDCDYLPQKCRSCAFHEIGLSEHVEKYKLNHNPKEYWIQKIRNECPHDSPEMNQIMCETCTKMINGDSVSGKFLSDYSINNIKKYMRMLNNL